MFDLSKFKLIVFDEVHHVVKNHPYRKVARLLQAVNVTLRPQVHNSQSINMFTHDFIELNNTLLNICEYVLF